MKSGESSRPYSTLADLGVELDNLEADRAKLDTLQNWSPLPDGDNSGRTKRCTATPLARVSLGVVPPRKVAGGFEMQTAWLIESKADGGAPEWLLIGANGMGWTKNANDALKFADKKSAEAFGNDYGILEGVPATVTEHGWPDGF